MSGLNVLVADSNQYMLKIIRAMLRGFGISNIREASDGAVALEELNMHLIDIVIADYALETLNGVELIELVRGAEDSPNRFVPIIMLSAYTEKWRIEAARDAGVTEFLSKPLCANDLYLRLIEVIEKPRQFIRTNRYIGPDRRRHDGSNYKGDEKRAAILDDSESGDAQNLVDELFG
jgi:CheY-like chemotaxis protein